MIVSVLCSLIKIYLDAPCSFLKEDLADSITKLLALNFEAFRDSLIYKTRVIAGEVIQSPLIRDECISYRNSLAKELYNRLFNWLVKRLNFSVMPPEFLKKGADIPKLKENYYSIGLLDIFGFEILEQNSLEQLFINFANEKLHQLYIEYVFKAEEKEFVNEGLKDHLNELQFKDNQVLLDMFDKINPPGIFQIIDELSSVTSTDSLLCDKITKHFLKPNMPFGMPRMGKDAFIIKHTAKDVEYSIDGFRAKNKDELTKTIDDVLCNSQSSQIVMIWKNLCSGDNETESQTAVKANPRDKFLSYKFRVQMKELIEELQKCECHFIRCVKPNELKESNLFIPSLVLKQISYMGAIGHSQNKKRGLSYSNVAPCVL